MVTLLQVEMHPVGSAEEVGGKYSQFQDVHVMIFIG
jgi:hypothetical protein